MSFGKISENEFESSLSKFVSCSSRLLDDWKLIQDQATGIKYAFKSVRKQVEDNKVLNIEHHIVYSVSYQVPVIYIRVFDENGRIWTDGQNVFELLSDKVHVEHLKAIKWEALTQQLHPIFQTPFFQLHPCHTDNWMDMVLKDYNPIEIHPDNYVVTWLSFVGPNVGIYLDNEYAKLNTQSFD